MKEECGVARLEAGAGIRFTQIAAARDRTELRLAERRERFGSVDVDPGGTVVLMGSWGRREVMSESDDDFMLLFEGAAREDAHPTMGRVAEVLEARGPGPEDVFGAQVWLGDLRGKIGRDEDTNTNLTRRMLFVLESVPVCGEDAFASARRALIAGYLDANVKDYRPPRFLLNNVIRYWRTIAVDFESKMRARKGEAGAFATRSSGFRARRSSPEDYCPSSSATDTPLPRCSATSTRGCPLRRSIG